MFLLYKFICKSEYQSKIVGSNKVYIRMSLKREKLRNYLALELAPIRNESDLQTILNDSSSLDLLSEDANRGF